MATSNNDPKCKDCPRLVSDGEGGYLCLDIPDIDTGYPIECNPQDFVCDTYYDLKEEEES